MENEIVEETIIEESVPAQEETPTEPIVQELPAIIPLRGYPNDMITVSDYGLTLCYKKVKTPLDTDTSYWTVHYKDNSSENWFTKNGLLSDRFSIARTEKILDQLVSGMNGELIDTKFRREDDYINLTFLLRGFTLPSVEITQADKILFKIFTDIDIDEIDNRRVLSFSLVNGFSGNYALTLNYGIMTSFIERGAATPQSARRLTINNSFILNEFSERLIHDNTLEAAFKNVEDVNTQLDQTVSLFKQTPVTARFIDEFKRKMPKKFVDATITSLDQLGDEFQNFYYLTYIWSHLCNMESGVYKELRLRKFLADYVKAARAEVTSNQ